MADKLPIGCKELGKAGETWIHYKLVNGTLHKCCEFDVDASNEKYEYRCYGVVSTGLYHKRCMQQQGYLW